MFMVIAMLSPLWLLGLMHSMPKLVPGISDFARSINNRAPDFKDLKQEYFSISSERPTNNEQESYHLIFLLLCLFQISSINFHLLQITL